jgi:hypothetical protein
MFFVYVPKRFSKVGPFGNQKLLATGVPCGSVPSAIFVPCIAYPTAAFEQALEW